MAALVPYLSLGGRLRDRHVLHWVDNTSAVAALAKGYSGAPDSARLVHAFHATAVGLRCACYFEYVRSAANVSDYPSRVDLSGAEWDCGLPGAGLLSRPVRAPCCRLSATGPTAPPSGRCGRGGARLSSEGVVAHSARPEGGACAPSLGDILHRS